MSYHHTLISFIDWRLILALLALLLAIFNIWYSTFRKGKLTFVCSRWTAIGLDVKGKPGASFALKIDIINIGSKPIVLKDLLLVAKLCNGKKVYYDPILLFDITDYIGSLNKSDRIASAQKGMVPLPVSIPPGEQFNFDYEILFMPHDKKTAVQTKTDAPFDLELFALSGKHIDYELISTQLFTIEDVGKLINGSFSGVLSASSTQKRDKFITKYGGTS